MTPQCGVRPEPDRARRRESIPVSMHIVLLFCFGLEYGGNLENLWFSDTFFSAAEHRRFSVEKTENVQGEVLNDTTVWCQTRA